MMLCCPNCLGSGWQDATLAGLSQVRVVGKDGYFVQTQCEKCKGTGQVDFEPPKA